ncbi:MAG: tetratricopeptide repeat protein [Clostridiales bacterium]|nr:tetratricopeptide repeat protein [Clostridiales bacterium]
MMKRCVITLLTGIALGASPINGAPTVAHVKELIGAGDYRSAIEALVELSGKEPRNTTYPVLLGDCYRALQQYDEAKAQYNKVVAKNNDARLGLIEIAIKEYRVDDADRLVEEYRKKLKKGRKADPDKSEDVTGQLERTRNMLNRVEQIVVFDSINVPAEEFFAYYRLSPESGSLNKPSVLPSSFPVAGETVVYEPESRTEMVWAAPDEDENYHLVSSSALYGDEWDTPVAIGDHLGEGGDANYPFLMPDGITLYYASNGDNTLGGYDLFITRRNGNSFLQPQNLGMPYNSPYNDYMLAIDESTGVGWWASDRNGIEGQVTIYMFKPSDMRVNVDVNDPRLLAKASLSSIAATWEPEADYTDLTERIAKISNSPHKLAAQCQFALPDGQVITRIEQLKESDARIAMRQYLDLQKNIQEEHERLLKLRDKYRQGDTSVAQEILQLEKRAINDRVTLKHAANEVIEAEMQ